jgi:hypothetical protein
MPLAHPFLAGANTRVPSSDAFCLPRALPCCCSLLQGLAEATLSNPLMPEAVVAALQAHGIAVL